jgi:hypothetical protein
MDCPEFRFRECNRLFRIDAIVDILDKRALGELPNCRRGPQKSRGDKGGPSSAKFSVQNTLARA